MAVFQYNHYSSHINEIQLFDVEKFKHLEYPQEKSETNLGQRIECCRLTEKLAIELGCTVKEAILSLEETCLFNYTESLKERSNVSKMYWDGFKKEIYYDILDTLVYFYIPKEDTLNNNMLRPLFVYMSDRLSSIKDFDTKIELFDYIISKGDDYYGEDIGFI